jgi:hypothetical protein
MSRATSARSSRGIAAIVPLLAIVLALAPVVALAQDPRPPANTTVSGEVKDVNPLTVEVNDQEYLLQTSSNVVVNRDGKEVKLGELNKGDKVTFTTNPDSSVQRIDVTDSATDESTWLLIGLIVLAVLVVVGLVWYLTQRRNRGGVAHGDRGLAGSHR